MCRGQRSTVSSPRLCEETECWPQNKFPFNVQTSKSTCPRCFVRLLPLSGPHPLTPVISLSALKQTSLPDTEIYSGCLCKSHLWQGQRAETRESYHMCKTSLNSCPSYSAASFIKCALKKCDPAWKKPCSYHMRWLKSKANTPTGVYTKTDDYRTQGLASTA